jgi:hypothetical protein
MEDSVYGFMILLDVFIAFAIFSIYFYVLFVFFLHTIEDNAIVEQVGKHLGFYKDIISLIKGYSQINTVLNPLLVKYGKISKDDPNPIPNAINNYAESVVEKPYTNKYATGKIIIIFSIISFFLVILIYFVLFYEKIIPHIKIANLLFTIVLNIILIVGIELAFVFLVYGSLELTTLYRFLNI